ncbi:MAG: GntR family transcriptional regulator [Planctomycetota bacterium]
MPVHRQSMRDQVRETLLRQIGAGQLLPGTRLLETRIAEELGVSPIPVREAIRELAAMGVVESATHRGAWVREVRLSETLDALEVKAGLEAEAARKAARALRGQGQELRGIVADMVAAAAKLDFVAFQQFNQAFHRRIVEAGGNQVLLRVWDSLGFEVRTRAVMDYFQRADAVAIAKEHERIVDALDGGRAAEAARLLRSHALDLVRYLEGIGEKSKRSTAASTRAMR